MLPFNELSSIQRRQAIDLRQVYDAWAAVDREVRHTFAGSIRWKTVEGADYLLRKRGRAERSLGRRSPETEAVYTRFVEGRARALERLRALTTALDTQAAIARAAGLGRVPQIAARLLRRLDEAGALGRIRIVGTNALFAYESMAGVHVAPEGVATGDIDLLLDARHQLRLAVDDAPGGLIGLIRKVDRSFEPSRERSYRVVNRDGYMVDLIRPEARPPWKEQPGDGPMVEGDLEASPIEGLQWLVNAPGVDAVAVDDAGYPTPFRVPDPRVWLLHKRWLSHRPMRDALRRRRDAEQADCVREMLSTHLPQFPLDDGFVAALPRPLQVAWDEIRTPPREADDMPRPNW